MGRQGKCVASAAQRDRRYFRIDGVTTKLLRRVLLASTALVAVPVAAILGAGPVGAQTLNIDTNNSPYSVTGGANTFSDTRTELGLRTDKSFAVNDALLTLRGRAAWAHDFNTDRAMAATFQSLPGASFTVNGAVASRDAALTSASAEMKWSNGWAIAATFDGEFSNTTRSYAGKGIVRYAW